MSEAKRMLDQATPLPWTGSSQIRSNIDLLAWSNPADAALIVYAVNRLPDYEAAVEALERLTKAAEMARRNLQGTTPCYCASSPHESYCGELLHATAEARAALARLRESEPARV